MVQNIVVVRFSLRFKDHPDWCRRAYGDEKNREAWFAFRSGLFKKGLFRCLITQSVRPAKVFLLLDQTDDLLYEKYLGLGHPIVPIFSGDIHHSVQVKDSLMRNEHTDLAISRIDSDDMISAEYFSELNRCISEATDNGISFDYIVASSGFRTDFKHIQREFNPCGPFLTFFRKEYNRETPFGFDHRAVIEKKHIQCASAEWMIVVHGSNIVNRFKPPSTSLEPSTIGGLRREIGPMVPVDRFWPHLFPRPEEVAG
jgi:hypothetical protein